MYTPGMRELLLRIDMKKSKRTRRSLLKKKKMLGLFFFLPNKNFMKKAEYCCASRTSCKDLIAPRTDTCSGVVEVLRQSYYLVLLLQSKAAIAARWPPCPFSPILCDAIFLNVV
jgi:hypothetical protein